jgi:cytochrome b561
MQFRSTVDGWGAILRTFHWVMVLLIAVMVPLGLYMTGLPLGVGKVRVYALHKSIGLVVLGLALLRLLWRASETRPTLSPMPDWQARAAKAVSIALYALLFAVPLSGWLFNSAAGFPLSWFGLVNLPGLTAANPTLKPIARELHATFVWVLLAVVTLHAAGAFKHHFVDRDRTLSLMLPWLKSPEGRR